MRLFKARNPSVPDPPYPFEGMIESLAEEWTNPSLPVGNLPSLRGDAEVHRNMASWIRSVTPVGVPSPMVILTILSTHSVKPQYRIFVTD